MLLLTNFDANLYLDMMFRSNMAKIKDQFCNLLTDVRSSLLELNEPDAVNKVKHFLDDLFQHGHFFTQTDLIQLFDAATANRLWTYDHYYPLDQLIKRFIPDRLSLITKYKGQISGFFMAHRLTDLIINKIIPFNDTETSLNEFELSPKLCKILELKLDLHRKIVDHSVVYVKELWMSLALEFDIPSLKTVIEHIIECHLPSPATAHVSPSSISNIESKLYSHMQLTICVLCIYIHVHCATIISFYRLLLICPHAISTSIQ